MVQIPSVFDVSPDASSIATRVGSTAGETRSTELMKSSRSITNGLYSTIVFIKSYTFILGFFELK